MTNAANEGIIKTGGVDMDFTGASGAIPRNDIKRMQEHAQRYYEEIRKRSSDVKSIENNTEFSKDDLEKIKQHIFINKYDLGYEAPKSFDPDYDMAVSWQRLIDGKDIREMDIIMLKHELMEYDLMVEKGLSYEEAHAITDKEYCYSKYINELNRREGIL